MNMRRGSVRLIKGYRYYLYFDGASKNNPGIGAGAYVLKNDRSEIMAKGGIFLQNCTNNQAEYTGLIEGLKKCVELNVLRVAVHGDSLLVVKQMNMEYKIKSPNLISLYEEANRILKGFHKVEFFHVTREENYEADIEANRIIDDFNRGEETRSS